MSWKSFELPSVPSSLSSATAGMSAITDASIASLKILQALAQTLVSLSGTSLSAGQLALTASLEVLEGSINSLMSDAGVYALHVPPRKRIVLPDGVRAALDRALAGGLPTAPIGRDMLDLEGSLAPDRQGALRSVLAADAGNAGFCRTVLESLVDAGDPNRPQPQATDHVYAICVMAGAPDIRNVLEFGRTMTAVFGGGAPAADLTPTGLPSPQSVRARQVVSGESAATLVEWDYQPAIVHLAGLDLIAQVTRVAVVRAQNPDVLSVATFKQLFGTAVPQKGLKADGVEVVAVLEYDHLTPPRSVVDPGPLEEGQDYYYAAGFEVALGDSKDLAQGTARPEPFDRLSNWAKMVPQAAPRRSVTGTPPDWVRTPSVMSLVPDLSAALQMLVAEITQAAGGALGFADMLQDHVDILGSQIAAFEGSINSLTATVDRLTANLSGGAGSAGAYVRVSDGQGGLPFFTNDLLGSFREPGAPPFTDGTEFVSGVVVMAHAPSAAALLPIKAALSLLFGGPSKVTSAVQQAMAAIDVELSRAEAALAAPAVSVAVRIGEDDDGVRDMNCPLPPSPPVFNDDFS